MSISADSSLGNSCSRPVQTPESNTFMRRRITVLLRRFLPVLLGWIATVVVCALLNRASESFEVAKGVALVFPAAALAVVSAVLLGWWGVSAIYVGFMVLPWGLSSDMMRAAYFAGASTLLAAIPALARLRPRGSTGQRAFRFLFFCCVLNTLASALAGVPMAAHLADPPMTGQQIGFSFSSWFIGDMVTVCLLAIPVVLLVRPGLLLSEIQVSLFRRWLKEWRHHLFLLAGIVVSIVIMEFTTQQWSINVHWIAVLLIAPVLWCAATGGVGGALLGNGVVGIVYLTEVLRSVDPQTQHELFDATFSTYVNLVAFTMAAMIAGLYAGRSKALLHELEGHRRLLQDGFENVVTALAAAIEAKDKSTKGHVERVADLAVALGRTLGIEGQRLQVLRYAAILHDVGKIGVPEEILNKRGSLTSNERRLVEEHVNIGVEILENVGILASAIPFIRYHQERWDGKRDAEFPAYFGLKGDLVPLEARIITLVDAFDAMISERPYRPAFSREYALAELRREAGKQFDPLVVDAFEKIAASMDD